VTARAAALFACVAVAACGSDASCPHDLPATCPSPAPSYSGEVKALIDTYCADCHRPGGQAADRPLDTYAATFTRRSAVLNQTYACAMPPPEFPQPTEAERVQLLGWLVCGAPNN